MRIEDFRLVKPISKGAFGSGETFCEIKLFIIYLLIF